MQFIRSHWNESATLKVAFGCFHSHRTLRKAFSSRFFVSPRCWYTAWHFSIDPLSCSPTSSLTALCSPCDLFSTASLRVQVKFRLGTLESDVQLTVNGLPLVTFRCSLPPFVNVFDSVSRVGFGSVRH